MALAVALLLILTHKLVIYAFTVTCYIVHSTILMVHWALKGKSNCTTQKQKSTRQDAEKGLEISAEENSTGIFECPTVAVHYANVFPKPGKTPPHLLHKRPQYNCRKQNTGAHEVCSISESDDQKASWAFNQNVKLMTVPILYEIDLVHWQCAKTSL